MKRRLTYINPWQVGKVMAVLHCLSSLLFLPIFWVLTLLPGPRGSHHAVFFLFGGVALIVYPVIALVTGYVFGLIAAGVFNQVATWWGGIEFIVADVVPGATAPPPPTSYVAPY
jgi:hypothetical protein